MKRILFPFIALFERLKLKQHWWHRLFMVLFILEIATSAAVAGFVVYAERFTLVKGVDTHKLAKDSFPQNLVEPKNEYSLDFYYEDPEFLKRVHEVSSAVPMISPDHKSTKLVPLGQVEEAQRQGWTKAVKMVSPEGKIAWVPSENVAAAKAAGFRAPDVFDELAAKADKSATLDMSSFTPCCPENWNVRTIQNVAVVAFPKEMSEDQVAGICQALQDRFAATERRTDTKRWLVGLLIYIAILLFALYSPQVLYRLFLYVILSPEEK